MTEPADVATKDAYEGAIRSFTEAEIALREIVAGLQRFRSASDQVTEAGNSLAEAGAAVDRASQAVEEAVVSLTAIAVSLGSATQVITALDPARFWESFDRLEASTASSATSLEQALAAGFAEAVASQTAAARALDGHIKTATESITREVGTSKADINVSITASSDQLSGRIRQTSEALQEATGKAAQALSSELGATQRIATQTRALATAGVVLAGVSVALLLFSLAR
jgi:hypothetical protein